MGVKEKLKSLFCTATGLDKVKRFLNLGCGAGVLLCSVLSILNIFEAALDLVGLVRHIWNALFGALMIIMQFNLGMGTWVGNRFGFLYSDRGSNPPLADEAPRLLLMRSGPDSEQDGVVWPGDVLSVVRSPPARPALRPLP